MLRDLKESLDGADVLNESLHASVDREALWADYVDDGVHDCCQQVLTFRWSINTLSVSVQQSP